MIYRFGKLTQDSFFAVTTTIDWNYFFLNIIFKLPNLTIIFILKWYQQKDQFIR